MLPDEDRMTLAETWHGYEQVMASVYQRYIEDDLNVSVKDLQQYHTERWLKHTFNKDNFVERPPIYTSTQDISQGVNLTNRFLLKFSINDKKAFEVDVRGKNPASTTIKEIITLINLYAGFEFARAITDNSLIQLVSNTTGINSNIKILPPSSESRDATEYILGIQYKELPVRFPEFPWVYKLGYDNIVSIPYLRSRVRDETEDLAQLVEGVDYKIENKTVILFKDEPLETLWAKKTYIDEETPWHNFGFLIGIYQKNNPSYMSVIKGLWYAFWTGPRPDTVQRSLYLLFGLPTSPFNGYVKSVTDKQIELISSDGRTAVLEIPNELHSIVTIGQEVIEYQPLVNGIEVFDKVNNPGFIKNEIGRVGIQRFLTEDATKGPGDTDETKALDLLEEYTFLPQISVESFISPDINMGNVKIFLNNIKPLVSTFLFQVVVGAFKDDLGLKDKVAFDISIDLTPNLDSNQTTFAEQSLLDDNEVNLNEGMLLDSDGMLLSDACDIQVYRKGILVEEFSC